MPDDDLEAIRRLKYAYFRLLDLKHFEELGELLTEDCTATYGDVGGVLEGRAAIVEFLSGALSDPGIVSAHHGHHPEIEMTGPDTASGVWYLEDRVIVPAADLEIGGTAFYRDQYRRAATGWRICHTGYERVYEEHRTHSTMEVQRFRSRF
jgi:ketosteroid isomerase-like protein